jgi:hypothetical protein
LTPSEEDVPLMVTLLVKQVMVPELLMEISPGGAVFSSTIVLAVALQPLAALIAVNV